MEEEGEEVQFSVLKDGGRGAARAAMAGYRDIVLERLGAARAAMAKAGADDISSVADVRARDGGGGGRGTGSRRTWRVLGAVLDKIRDRRGGVELVLEDEGGSLRAGVAREALSDVLGVLPDEVVLAVVENGFGGSLRVRRIERIHNGFKSSPARKASRRMYAAFLSDLHCRYEEDCETFRSFVDWISTGRPEGDLARGIRYIIMGGDIADCGCEDYRKVYNELARSLMDLPEDIVKVVIPGECDAASSMLPQPAIEKRYRGLLEEVPNVHLVGNPALVSLSGVKVLLYHGQSLPFIMKELGLARPTEAMRRLMSMDSLVPSAGGCMASPDSEVLHVSSPPDIMHVGHVHMPDVHLVDNTLFLSTPNWRGDASRSLRPWGLDVPRAALVDLSTLDVIWRGPTYSSAGHS